MAAIAVIVFALCIFLFAWMIQKQKAFRLALQEAARKLGIRYVPGTWLKAARAEGSVGGFNVVLDTYTVSTGKSSQTFTRITVDTSIVLPDDLFLEREGAVSAIKKAFIGEDIQVGDPAFDGRIVARGDSRTDTISRLDHETRRWAHAAIFELKARLKKGKLQFTRGGFLADTAQLESITRTLVALANGLAHRDQPRIERRLLANAEADPAAGVRQQSLIALLTRYAGTPEGAQAAELGAKDADPFIRDVAIALGPGPVQDRTDKLLALLDNRIPGGGRPLLELPEVALAAVVRLGEVGGVSAVERLLALVEEAEDQRIRRAARNAIGAIQSRLSGAGAGQLSLAEQHAGGELSLNADRGGLSTLPESTSERELDHAVQEETVAEETR